jgi:hypothetical protein
VLDAVRKRRLTGRKGRLINRSLKVVASTAAAFAVATFLIAPARAANSASDDAGNYTTSTWGSQSGQPNPNLGSGFGAWIFFNTNFPSSAGFFLQSSATNGIGSATNIDTSGVSWGAYHDFGNTNGELDVVRPLTGGTLGVGQSIQFSTQIRSIDGGPLGFSLLDGNNPFSSQHAIEYYFVGGDANFKINTTNEVDLGTGDPYTFDGQIVTFTLVTTNTVNLTVQNVKSGAIFTTNGISLNPAAGPIASLRFFDAQSVSGSGNDVFFNSFSVFGGAQTNIQITSIKVVGGTNSLISFQSISNALHALQFTTNLAPTGVWTTVTNNITGTGGVLQVQDVFAPGQQKRFYRIQAGF